MEKKENENKITVYRCEKCKNITTDVTIEKWKERGDPDCVDCETPMEFYKFQPEEKVELSNNNEQ